MKSSHYTDGGVRLVRLQNIGAGEFMDEDKAYISHEHFGSLAGHDVQAGDLLVAGLGDENHPVGRACVYPRDFPTGMVKADCFRFRLDPRRLRHDYIALFLSSAVARGLVAMHTRGATRERINLRSIAALEVPFPPVAEQIAIVSFVSCKTAALDHIIRKKERLVELLQEKRQALITHPVTRGLDPTASLKDSGFAWLGEIPSHWEVQPLRRAIKSMCDGPFGSDMKSMHYSDEGVRLIRLQNLGVGFFNDQDKVYISEEHFASLPGHDVRPNDLLVAGLGDESHPVGRACLYPPDQPVAMVKADCFRLRLDVRKLTHSFAALFLSSVPGQRGVALQRRGATRARMNLSGLAQLQIAIPPLDEQHSIARYVHKKEEALATAGRKVREQLLKLSEYRQSLVSSAVTGKIDICFTKR